MASHGVELDEVKSPGIISGSPYTSAADDVWRSSFWTTLMPNSTQGSSSTQLGCHGEGMLPTSSSIHYGREVCKN